MRACLFIATLEEHLVFIRRDGSERYFRLYKYIFFLSRALLFGMQMHKAAPYFLSIYTRSKFAQLKIRE